MGHDLTRSGAGILDADAGRDGRRRGAIAFWRSICEFQLSDGRSRIRPDQNGLYFEHVGKPRGHPDVADRGRRLRGQ